MYESDEYRIYGAFINTKQYPKIKLSKYGTVCIVGDIQELNLGVAYIVKAIPEQSKYGWQYKIQNIKRPKPNTVEASRAFLYEIITPNQADELLKHYPDIVDRIINNRLSDIDLNKTYGIKDYIFNVIKRKVIENFKLADLVDEFEGLFNISTLKKIYDKYPSIEKVREVLRDDPYHCLTSFSRIGFKTADKMLLDIDKKSKKNIEEGKKPILFFNCDLRTSCQRMKSCVDYLLDENENDGHTYMDVRELKKQCGINAKEAMEHLPAVIRNEKFYFDVKSLRIAKHGTFETEEYIAKKICEGIKNRNCIWKIDVDKYRMIDDLELTDEQIQSLKNVCMNQVTVLNGFAGSGKSQTTKALINLLKEHNKSFCLFAPTGRAAKVLTGYTGKTASTIHRGLGYKPPNEWGYNSVNQLSADIVIVDETSMVDVFLMEHLLEAIDFRITKLLLIGDDAQIPSVGAGNILYDLLHAQTIPTVTLSKIFRYGEGGLMTVATDTRNSKEYLDKDADGLQAFGIDKSYMFMSLSQNNLINNIVALYQKLLSQGHKPEDIGVLSCYNKGDYGTTKINNKIQEAVNPNAEKSMKYGEIEYRLGDLVIQCKNEYHARIYPDCEIETFIPNGEIGKIIDIEKNWMVVDYDGIQIYYTKGEIANIKMAYSISTHKSQGGQYRVVVLVTPKAHTYMLNSNLLYVGETRAKEKCYHLGDMLTVNRALKKKENFDRKTFLGDLLREVVVNG